jgi:hypothetical protein
MAVKVQNQFASPFRICINVECMSIFSHTDRLILTVHLLTPAISSLLGVLHFIGHSSGPLYLKV